MSPRSRACLAAVLALVAVLLNGCTNYELEVKYTCDVYDANDKVCKAWTQRGTMFSSAACFPANATVIARAGPKPMSEVAIGDELLGLDHRTGLIGFSAVRAWMHRDAAAELPMVRIVTEAGDIVTSPFHSVATDKAGSYAFARTFKEGDSVVTAKGPARVSGVRAGSGSGLYSPLTMTSNFFVADGAEVSLGSSFLAHSFAHVHFPRRTASVLHAFLSAAELVRPDFNELGDDGAPYVHPVGRLAMRLGVPLAGQTSRFEIEGSQVRRLAGGGGSVGNNQQQQEQEAVLLVNMMSGGPPVLFRGSHATTSGGTR